MFAAIRLPAVRRFAGMTLRATMTGSVNFMSILVLAVAGLAAQSSYRSSTNVRTLENWEQGRAKPNAQAALLISLVKRFPDTVERLAAIRHSHAVVVT